MSIMQNNIRKLNLQLEFRKIKERRKLSEEFDKELCYLLLRSRSERHFKGECPFAFHTSFYYFHA